MFVADDKIYGIQELHRPEDREPDIEEVRKPAVRYILNGDARKTWTSKGSRICWLDHPDFLPKYIKNARVLVWGYNASFSSLTGDRPSKDRIHHHAHTLVANLAADRRLSGMQHKPIIFLCHSLGGIIVKRVLSYAQTRTSHKVAQDYSIFSCTYGIFFFGTPHHGSSKARWLAYLKRVGSLVTPLPPLSITPSDLVTGLESESETLQNITDYFVPLMRHFSIYFFWEQQRTDLRLMGRDYIVTQESAAPPFDDTERAGIAADHSGMVKFEDAKAKGFRTVVDGLFRYCEEAPEAIRRRRATETILRHAQAQQDAALLNSQSWFQPNRPLVEDPRPMASLQTFNSSLATALDSRGRLTSEAEGESDGVGTIPSSSSGVPGSWIS